MEQIVKVITTVHVEMLVHGNEPYPTDSMIERIIGAMNTEAAQFIVCADHDRSTFPSWIATISDMRVAVDRVRTIDIDLTDA